MHMYRCIYICSFMPYDANQQGLLLGMEEGMLRRQYLYVLAFGRVMPIIRIELYNALPPLANKVKGRRLGIGGGPS